MYTRCGLKLFPYHNPKINNIKATKIICVFFCKTFAKFVAGKEELVLRKAISTDLSVHNVSVYPYFSIAELIVSSLSAYRSTYGMSDVVMSKLMTRKTN